MTQFDLSKDFGSDADLERDGVWESLSEETKILVASTDSPSYREAFNKINRATRRRIDRNALSEAEEAQLMSGIIAKTLLLDWQNLADGGKIVPYSYDVAKDYLIRYPKFRRFVIDLAGEESRFRSEEKEEAEKNSSKSSDGPSKTEPE